MRSTAFRAVFLTALLMFVTGGPAVIAQGVDDSRLFHQQDRRQPTFRLFGGAPVVRDLGPARAPSVAPRRVAPATVVVRDQPSKPVVEATTFVVVMGDSLADLMVAGLGEAFEDVPEVAIVRRSRPNSGLVRSDFYDWPKSVQDLLSSPDKVSFAVMMAGANDRQVIREGEVSHEPLSERWRQIYIERIDAITRAFAEKRIPLIWVGLPPVKNERLSGDFAVFNDIYRERVLAAGGIYVDLWEAFVDEENRFVMTGPDLSGQPARLRTADGVHFTRAGARKAAHFIEQELRRLMDTAGPTTILALQNPGMNEQQQRSIEQIIDASIPPLPEPPGVPSIPVKPLAGPILPLNQASISPGGALVTAGRRLTPVSESVFVDGSPPEPVSGRADDFSWPRRP